MKLLEEVAMSAIRVKLSRNIGLCESAAADPALQYFDDHYGGELYLEAEAEFPALPRSGDPILSNEELIVKRVTFAFPPPESGPEITIEVERDPQSFNADDLDERGGTFDGTWILHPDADDLLADDLLSALLSGWKLTSITEDFQRAFLRMLDELEVVDDPEDFHSRTNMNLLKNAIRQAHSY